MSQHTSSQNWSLFSFLLHELGMTNEKQERRAWKRIGGRAPAFALRMCLRLVPTPRLACAPGKYPLHLAAQLLQKTNTVATLGCRESTPGGRHHCSAIRCSISGFPGLPFKLS